MIWREWHHGYLGLALVGAAAALKWPSLLVVGFWLTLDDAYQHLRQESDPDYRSPLHRWYVAYLWPLPPIQALNRWLDRVFR